MKVFLFLGLLCLLFVVCHAGTYTFYSSYDCTGTALDNQLVASGRNQGELPCTNVGNKYVQSATFYCVTNSNGVPVVDLSIYGARDCANEYPTIVYANDGACATVTGVSGVESAKLTCNGGVAHYSISILLILLLSALVLSVI